MLYKNISSNKILVILYILFRKILLKLLISKIYIKYQ